MADENIYINLRDQNGRPFVLYGHDDSWCAVYTTRQGQGTAGSDAGKVPTMLAEYERAELALQNIQES